MATETIFKRDVSLADLTTFKVGGRAAYYLTISEPEELVRVVRQARALEIPYRLMAGGSNIVFPDDFYVGLVIQFLAKKWPKLVAAGGLLEVPASLPLATLIASSIRQGYEGLEALSGIPGTVGGALVGNAGAYGQSISDTLVSVQIWDGESKLWLAKKDCQFRYRESIFKQNPPAGGWLVLRAKFKLSKGVKKVLAQKSREIIAVRNKKYQPGLRCPGSFFKNVVLPNGEKIPAGQLLEQVGACGLKLGGLEVASFHGNLLINRGGATYEEVRTLAQILKDRVYQKFGIQLEEEVRYML